MGLNYVLNYGWCHLYSYYFYCQKEYFQFILFLMKLLRVQNDPFIISFLNLNS